MALRILVAILGTLACVLIYAHRAGMSVAIVAMVIPKNASNHNISHSCIADDHHSNKVTGNGKYEWSETLQGLVLGAGYYMYIFTPTLSGRITDKFGAKWLTAVTIITPAILSALTPIAADYHIWLLIVVRVLISACHGCVWPSIFSLYAHWIPSSERSTAIAALAFGANLGTLVTFPLSGYLCEYGFAGGWPSVFYVIALAHVPWLLLWIYFVEDTPSKSSKISEKEILYIQKNVKTFSSSKRSVAAPWKAIVTSKPVWASIAGKVFAGWGYYLILTKMPSYLDTAFGISIVDNGLYSALTTLGTAITMLIGGPLSEIIIKRTNLSKTRVRKIFEDIALIGPAICVALVPAMGCNYVPVVALLAVSQLFYGINTGGEYPIVSELAPDFAGTVFGFVATISILPAIVTPYVVGVLLDNKPGEISQWNIVFYITVAFYVIGAVIFELWASAEPQHWAVITTATTNTTNNNNGIEKICDKNTKTESDVKEKIECT